MDVPAGYEGCRLARLSPDASAEQLARLPEATLSLSKLTSLKQLCSNFWLLRKDEVARIVFKKLGSSALSWKAPCRSHGESSGLAQLGLDLELHVKPKFDVDCNAKCSYEGQGHVGLANLQYPRVCTRYSLLNCQKQGSYPVI